MHGQGGMRLSKSAQDNVIFTTLQHCLFAEQYKELNRSLTQANKKTAKLEKQLEEAKVMFTSLFRVFSFSLVLRCCV